MKSLTTVKEAEAGLRFVLGYHGQSHARAIEVPHNILVANARQALAEAKTRATEQAGTALRMG